MVDWRTLRSRFFVTHIHGGRGQKLFRADTEVITECYLEGMKRVFL